MIKLLVIVDSKDFFKTMVRIDHKIPYTNRNSMLLNRSAVQFQNHFYSTENVFI